MILLSRLERIGSTTNDTKQTDYYFLNTIIEQGCTIM